LKVLKNTDGPLQAMRGTAQSLDPPGVFRMCSVGEIQTRNVHAQAHQVANHFLGITSGANRADNLCAAHALGRLFGHRPGSRQISFN